MNKYTGRRQSMLVVKEWAAGSRLVCICDCGKERVVSVGHFNTGAIKSCGCHVERHGHAARGNKSREYSSWGNMIARCHNKKNKRYHDYGGRGVLVCKRWRESFKDFFADMGVCPAGFQIDRIDNNGAYEASNCKWVAPKENMANRRNSKTWVVYGERFRTTSDAAKRMNVSNHTIRAWCQGRLAEGRCYKPKENCYVEPVNNTAGVAR